MKQITRKLSPFIPLIVLYIIFLCLNPAVFNKLGTIGLILQNAIIPCLLSWGLSLNFYMDIIDFSLGAELTLMTIISVFLSRSYGIWGLIFGAILSGLVTGSIKILIFNITKANTMVISISLTILFAGLSNYVSTNQNLALAQNLLMLGSNFSRGVFFFACMAIYFVINNYSAFASKVRAFGGSPSIAATSGIKSGRLKIGTIAVGTFFCIIAAIISVSKGAGAAATQNLDSMQMVFASLMAYFIASSFTGRMDITFGIIIGSLCFSVLNIGLLSINMPANYNNTIIGVGLLILLTVTGASERRKRERLYRQTCQTRRMQGRETL